MRLAERFDHRSAAHDFLEFKPSLFFGVPTIYVRLLDPAVISHRQAREIGLRNRDRREVAPRLDPLARGVEPEERRERRARGGHAPFGDEARLHEM